MVSWVLNLNMFVSLFFERWTESIQIRELNHMTEFSDFFDAYHVEELFSYTKKIIGFQEVKAIFVDVKGTNYSKNKQTKKKD